MPKVNLSANQFCSETGKQRHPNEDAANQRARNAEREDPQHKRRNVYLCNACNEWHVTQYGEYRPRVDDGSQSREQPRWMRGWHDAAQGKVVTGKRFR